MGRPERTDLEIITTSEIAKATGISPRNFALLIDKNLAPEPSRQASGQGGARAYDGIALAHAALIGALNLAGFELLVSARLAEAFAEDQYTTYGKLVSNLGAFLQRPYNPTPGHTPWDRATDGEPDLDRDYWLHNRLRKCTDFYQRGVALTGDFVIEIADNTYVMSSSYGLEKIKVFSPVSDGLPVGLEYRIVGRGSATNVVRVTDEYSACDVFEDAGTREKLRALEAQYMTARDNAVALVRINVGLAIRQAFDSLYDLRQR